MILLSVTTFVQFANKKEARDLCMHMGTTLLGTSSRRNELPRLSRGTTSRSIGQLTLTHLYLNTHGHGKDKRLSDKFVYFCE